MTQEQKRIKIAEACGLQVSYIANPINTDWNKVFFTPEAANQRRKSWPQSAVVKVIPDYLNDLNAMHEAEKTLFPAHEAEWYHKLHTICGDSWRIALTATATQRAEAFGLTLGLWK